MDQWRELSQAIGIYNEQRACRNCTVGHTQAIEPSCRSEYCSAPPFVRMILPALNTYGHGNGWVPFFSDSIWTPQESDKMHQNSVIRPKIECPWRNWAQNLDRALSFSSFLEWNDKKCQFFTRFQHFLTLTYTYGIIFRRKYAKPDIIRKHVA